METRSVDQAARAAQNEYMRLYMRQYRKKNPDKMRAIAQRYWARKAEKSAEMRQEETTE